MKLGILGTLSIGAMLVGQVTFAETVKIGFVTTLTGGAGAIGNDMRDAVELALDHLGRKMGSSNVKMFYEDDTFKPDVGKLKTEKLVKKDKVHFVTGYIWSHVLMASRNSVVGKGPFMITSNAGPGPVAGKLCHEDFFSTSWQNDQTTMAMGEVLSTWDQGSLHHGTKLCSRQRHGCWGNSNLQRKHHWKRHDQVSGTA